MAQTVLFPSYDRTSLLYFFGALSTIGVMMELDNTINCALPFAIFVSIPMTVIVIQIEVLSTKPVKQ